MNIAIAGDAEAAAPAGPAWAHTRDLSSPDKVIATTAGLCACVVPCAEARL